MCGEWTGLTCVESGPERHLWRVDRHGMCDEWTGVPCVESGQE